MISFSTDPFEYIAPTVCISTLLLMPFGPLYVPRFWITFMSCYFLVFLGTQVNHLLQFYKTANKIKQTIQAYNDNNDTAYQPQEEKEVESLMTNLPHKDYLVHAFVIPNYSEPEALIRDTISRIAIHK